MEHFSIIKTEYGFEINGFPNAIKAIKISGPQAQRLSDLALHKSDLDFAFDCINAINTPPQNSSELLQQALWRSAIIHYIKCFGNSESRFQLNFNKIYKGEPVEAKQAFDYFQDLRNKHFIHDENSYAQSIPGAILNKKEVSYKIEKIVTINMIVQTLSSGEYGNLKLLIEKAHAWVVSQYDTLCNLLTKELEQESYENLLARDNLDFTTPEANSLSQTRSKV